jgi:hypothetical protein
MCWDSTRANTQSPASGILYNTYEAPTNGGSLATFWCGARVLTLTRSSGGFYLASLSTDGLAFGGDNTVAVLGSASVGNLVHMNFYRNNNACFLSIGGTVYRQSSDGGVTWSAVTFSALNAENQNNFPNVTDPARRIMNQGDGTAAAYYTADSGATWSASRPFPQSSRYGIVYRGSTVISSYNDGCFRSVDDGVTYTSILFPAGTNSSVGQVVADENRFYFIPTGGGSQLLTSTDAITWTIRATPGTMSGTGGVVVNQVSSNVVFITNNGMNSGFFTLDGGVTWGFASSSTSGTAGANWTGYFTKATTDGPNGGYLIYGKGNRGDPAFNFFLSSAAVTAGGGFYRTGTTTISPIRSSAISFVRVG